MERLPLVSVGATARGVIAIGNVATGIIAIGGSLSFGVVAIGGNAVGGVAIGLNAMGPIALAAINGAGVVVLAGVNAIGGAGRAFVNDGTWFPLGVVAATAIFAFASVLVARRRREAAKVALPPATASIAELPSVEPGTYVVWGRPTVHEQIAIVAGTPLADPDALARPHHRRACAIGVRVAERFAEDDPANYREAARRERTLTVVSVTPRGRTPLDVPLAIGVGLQVASVAALALSYLV